MGKEINWVLDSRYLWRTDVHGGHVPGARSVPWKTTAKEDGTFKTRAELEKIYRDSLGYNRDGDTIVYCRIGERSSHRFVLTKSARIRKRVASLELDELLSKTYAFG